MAIEWFQKAFDLRIGSDSWFCCKSLILDSDDIAE